MFNHLSYCECLLSPGISLDRMRVKLNERKPRFIYVCVNVAIFNAPHFQESQLKLYAKYLA